MARQSTTPVSFTPSTRRDAVRAITSGRAGVVVPVDYLPLLPGDSCSGRVGIDIELKDMPKPLANGVGANFQAWFIPRTAMPQFAGRDEYLAAMQGTPIKALGQPDRAPQPFFSMVSAGSKAIITNSELFRSLGIHIPSTRGINTDLIDAFALVYNFRLAAHSSKLERRPYCSEDVVEATKLPRAFWPSNRLSRVVPDYERALIMGALDLDVGAGQVTLSGQADVRFRPNGADIRVVNGSGSIAGAGSSLSVGSGANNGHLMAGATRVSIMPNGQWFVNGNELLATIGAGGAGSTLPITTAQLDKARTAQAFGKLRTAYAGNDATGFENDDAIVATLMQGLSVPEDDFKRPWLLDAKRVPVGFAERFATDAANLDQSTTVGRAGVSLSLNVPRQDVGGMIIITCEVLPERFYERMADDYLSIDQFMDLPNALRDVQRVEPVDLVPNRRLDAKHSQPDALYGYEPMNDRWNRDFTRLGGQFFSADPGQGWTESRSNIWQTEIIDPVFNDQHYLAPSPFPHTVFSDANADAFECVVRHEVAIVGLTQIGDVLQENNDDYEAVTDLPGGGSPGPNPGEPA